MAKYAGYDSELKIGTQQTHYATIVCDGVGDVITTAGNAEFSANGTVLGGLATATVALAENDNAQDCARKAAIGLNAEAGVSAWATFYAVGHLLYCRLVEAAANDAGVLIDYEAVGGTVGLQDDMGDGTAGVGGVAELSVAYVTNISGPGLGIDTEDVTTHDSTAAYEEVVATIVRSGELSLDIVYDPGIATHDAGTGLVYRLEDEIYSFFKLIFTDDTEWEFSGYVTGFEPSGPVGGALTAAVKIKPTGQPLLA